MVVSVRPSELLHPDERIERDIYTDPEIYRLEQKRIFRRAWIFAGVESELPRPRDFITTFVGEEPVVVTRNNSGELRAFFNTCTHRAAMVAVERHGNCPAFRCMYHGWTYDLEGHLTGVPYPEAYGDDFERSDFNIPQLRVASFAGLIFVSINPLVERLTDFLGDVAPWVKRYCDNGAGLELLGKVRWRYPGNWKLWHENFADNYHPEFVHKTIGEGYRGVQVSGWNYQLDDGHGLLLFPTKSQRRVDRQQAQFERALGRDIKFAGPSPSNEIVPPQGLAPSVDSPELGNGILTVFPTLDIQAAIGRAGGTPVLQVVRPVGVDSTIVEAWSLGVKGAPPEVRQRRLDFAPGVGPADFISADDNEAVARCQIGAMASGVSYSNMARGRAPGKEGAKRDEYSLRSFYRGWHMYMAD